MEPWVEWGIVLIGLAVVGLVVLVVYLVRQAKHLLGFYAMMFEERARQLEEQAHELAQVEQRIKDVEGRLAARGRSEG